MAFLTDVCSGVAAPWWIIPDNLSSSSLLVVGRLGRYVGECHIMSSFFQCILIFSFAAIEYVHVA